MAHNREKKALYEVMSKVTWPKPHADKALEPPLQQQPTEEPRRDEHPVAKLAAPAKARWLNRPRMVQYNAGRIEISIPYQLAIALLLGLIVLVLIAFKLGLYSKEVAGPGAKNTAAGAPRAAASVGEKTPAPPVVQKVELAKPKGDNRVVIQSYQFRADLEPVKQYFAQFGIETEIIKIDAWYYLVTKDKYENPGKPGTDGYLAKQRIVELGAKYKAPAGYETFGSTPFSDAYGKKFEE
jgi:hypothetical protein